MTAHANSPIFLNWNVRQIATGKLDFELMPVDVDNDSQPPVEENHDEAAVSKGQTYLEGGNYGRRLRIHQVPNERFAMLTASMFPKVLHQLLIWPSCGTAKRCAQRFYIPPPSSPDEPPRPELSFREAAKRGQEKNFAWAEFVRIQRVELSPGGVSMAAQIRLQDTVIEFPTTDEDGVDPEDDWSLLKDYVVRLSGVHLSADANHLAFRYLSDGTFPKGRLLRTFPCIFPCVSRQLYL